MHALRHADLRQALYDEAAILMERVIVNLHGPEHRARRMVEAVVFRRDVFLDYERNVLPRMLRETCAPVIVAGMGDLVDLGYRIMMNVTVDFTGIDRPAGSVEETGNLLRLLREFSLAPALGQSHPDDVEPKRRRIAAAMDEFEERFFRPSRARREALIADWRAGRIKRDRLPNDVLTAILLGQDKLGLSEHEIVQESIFYVLAGAHTSIHSLVHAAHELLQWLDGHPEDRERLRRDPFFLQRCVCESLRLHPSSPVARRRALQPVSLPEVGKLGSGAQVSIDLRAANHDTVRFGDDAEAFNPHRTVRPGTFSYGLSMGDGMHACLGRHLAIGVDPKADADPATHQYGVIALILAELLKRGLRSNPVDPPEMDRTISRITWTRYPIIFRPEEALL